MSSAPDRCAFLHFILQAASALAAFAQPSHVFIYAPGDLFSCHLDATRMILCILFPGIHNYQKYINFLP
ncbi:hypothetical protein CLM67_22690 [Serratia marcescens]|nr:hypothetical protein CLM67_22690 [Serratia marcescens]